jgi:putative Holliday junction resolvase
MNNESRRVLAVDSGAERIGLAISDLTGTIANPLRVIKHVKRGIDAEVIVSIATENDVVKIVVGQAFYEDGTPNPSGRKSARLAEAIQKMTNIPVILWDESESTQIARKAREELGVVKKKRRGHMDALAATVILQTFLDANKDMDGSDSKLE